MSRVEETKSALIEAEAAVTAAYAASKPGKRPGVAVRRAEHKAQAAKRAHQCAIDLAYADERWWRINGWCFRRQGADGLYEFAGQYGA